MIRSWKGTRLWKKIDSIINEAAGNVKVLLLTPAVMESIETILSKGSTSAKDFTLHDESHSFRVAERMVDIIPVETFELLSAYDLMMLLLSAYLHDIGMTPEASKVSQHLETLTTDQKKLLSDEELREFQKWLDLENFNIDIRRDKLNDLNKSYEIITYYSRYKHNDWSEEWILKNLSTHDLNGYIRWQNDLINICKSHHYGYDFLSLEKFDPRIVNGTPCHRRYIAMCLRVADVLEIDPERTPPVILRHRDVAERSIIYWLKDQEIGILIKDGSLSVYARPQQAFLHKAVSETVIQIKNELDLCNQLVSKKSLNDYNGISHDTYRWNLFLQSVDIKPFEDFYVYINGSFRPNVKRVLELLGGSELYGDKIVAIRELLQNSFDAVKERIAYKRLTSNLLDSAWQKKLGEEYTVSVELMEDKEGVWLVCKDQGVGMTKEIIENYFLVSGSSQKHETSELARKCLTANIEYERTGKFGIGVLSYFMISEKIVIKSKRVQDTGYQENDLIGWQFTIEGIEEFGELIRVPINGSGSEIRLLLKENVFGTKIDTVHKVKDYIESVLVNIPCKFEFSSPISDSSMSINFSAGWTKSEEYVLDSFFLSEKGYDSQTSSDTSYYNVIDSLLSETEEEKDLSYISSMQKSISTYVIEDALPNELGNFRVIIPYFKLSTGSSFCYAEGEWVDDIYKLKNIGYMRLNEPNLDYGKKRVPKKWFSWKGFFIDFPSENYLEATMRFQSFYYEINLSKYPFSITVDRNTLQGSETAFSEVYEHINTVVQDSLDKIVESMDDGIWYLYNRVFCKNLKEGQYKNKHWFFDFTSKTEGFQLKKIGAPIGFYGQFDFDKRYTLNSEKIDVSNLSLYQINNTDIGNIMPEEVELNLIKHINGKNSLGASFKQSYARKSAIGKSTFKGKFPLKWDSFVGFADSYDNHNSFCLLNLKYFTTEITDTYNLQQLEFHNANRTSTDEFLEKLKSDKILSQEFLIYLLFINKEYWQGMKDKYFDALKIVWFNVFGDLSEIIVINNLDTVHTISLEEWKTVYNVNDVTSFLGQPDPESIIMEELRPNY